MTQSDAKLPDVTPSEPALLCRDVTHGYRVGAVEVPVLHDVSLALGPGSFTAVAGPSGSGKSTLLRLVASLERPDRGSIKVGDVEVSRLSPRQSARLRRRTVGFVRQAPSDNLISYLTVRQHMTLAAQMRGANSRDDLLARLGLDRHHDRLPRQLSGGEQQRVAIAFAASGRPGLLVADEPTGQLDHGYVNAVVTALRSVADTGVCVVAATHDHFVWERTDRVLWIRDGRLSETTE